jgi:hypothetical protein
VNTTTYGSSSSVSVRQTKPSAPGLVPGRESVEAGSRTRASRSVERNASVLPSPAAVSRLSSTSLAGWKSTAGGGSSAVGAAGAGSSTCSTWSVAGSVSEGCAVGSAGSGPESGQEEGPAGAADSGSSSAALGPSAAGP